MSDQFDLRTGAKAFGPGNSNYRPTVNQTAGTLFTARVSKVLLDDSNQELFDALGGWSAIGAIRAVPFIGTNESDFEITAYPMDPNMTKFPLENELALIVVAPSYTAQNSKSNYFSQYYYIGVVPGFNAVEQNCIPNESKIVDSSEQVSGRFSSKGTVKRIKKAPGDITFEGRGGSGIRLGSSVDGFETPIKGKDRAPYVLIHNSQNSDGEEVTFEDVNKDGSSIYLVSGHNTGIELSSLNFNSYFEQVEPSQMNNYIVTDQTIESPDEEPLVEKDTTPVQDVIPENKEVKTPTKATTTAPSQEDEEILPVRESETGFVTKTEPPAVFTSDVVQFNTESGMENDPMPVDVSKEVPAVDRKVFVDLPAHIKNFGPYKTFINTPGVSQKIDEICRKLLCRPVDILVTIYAESKFDTKAVNKNSNATGLIQFMPATARYLGTSVEAIYNMSATQQLEFAYRFYKPATGKLVSVYEFYSYTFVPISVGKPNNWVYQWKTSKGRVSAEEVSRKNSVICKKAGIPVGSPITRAHFFKYVNAILEGK